MKASKYSEDLSQKLGIRKSILIMLALSIITNCFLALVIIVKKNNIMTVMVPPEIYRPISIGNMKISKEYLEDFSVYATQLLMNVTPTTVESQQNQLLKYVSPKYFDALSQELIATAKFVKANNISTWFVPLRVTAYESSNSVEVEGTFFASQGGKVTEKLSRIFVVSYDNRNGRISINSIREMQPTERRRRQLNKESAASAEQIIEEEYETVPFGAEGNEAIPPQQPVRVVSQEAVSSESE